MLSISDLVFGLIFWFGGLVRFIDTQFVLNLLSVVHSCYVVIVYIKVVCLRSILYNVVVVFVPHSVFVIVFSVLFIVYSNRNARI